MAKRNSQPKTACYLIHFSSPLGHARHYAGFVDAEKRGLPCAEAVEAKLGEHKAKRGARICTVAVERGIELVLARTWPGKGRKFERWLKRGSLVPYCPLCRHQYLVEKRTKEQARRSQRKSLLT